MSEQLLLRLPRLRLFLVDRWEAPSPDDVYWRNQYWTEQTRKAFTSEAQQKSFRECQARLKPFVDALRAWYYRGPSVDMAMLLPDHSLDLVFIDADHSYEGVCQDLLAWAPKVKPGGLLGGHDYDRPEIGQVKEAVQEWCWDYSKALIVGDCFCWWVEM